MFHIFSKVIISLLFLNFATAGFGQMGWCLHPEEATEQVLDNGWDCHEASMVGLLSMSSDDCIDIEGVKEFPLSHSGNLGRKLQQRILLLALRPMAFFPQRFLTAPTTLRTEWNTEIPVREELVTLRTTCLRI